MKNAALLLLAILSLAACGGDEAIVDPGPHYLPRTHPENVIENLVTSYNERDIDGYAALLADDFQLYFDEGSRQQNPNLPVFRTRMDEIAVTGSLFRCPAVTDIHLVLRHGAARPANEVGRGGWVYVDALDVFLEVELVPDPPGSVDRTVRLDGGEQRFYLRKGRTPADRASETWYLVEWRDYGARSKPRGEEIQAVQATTWEEIRTLCRQPPAKDS